MKQLILLETDQLEQLAEGIKEVKSLLLKERNHPSHLDLLRTSEVKKILKLKDSSLATLRQNGTLPFSKVGGTIYYLKEDILELIRNNYSGKNEKHIR